MLVAFGYCLFWHGNLSWISLDFASGVDSWCLFFKIDAGGLISDLLVVFEASHARACHSIGLRPKNRLVSTLKMTHDLYRVNFSEIPLGIYS